MHPNFNCGKKTSADKQMKCESALVDKRRINPHSQPIVEIETFQTAY